MKAKDVRKNTVVLHNKDPHKVLDFHHNAPGKGRATVWIKMRSMITGTQTETTVGSTDDIDEADVTMYKATFLYKDGDGYHFMGVDNYEQVSMSAELVGDTALYLQEEMNVDITTFNEEPIGINLPATVVLTVVETEPELKTATVTNIQKPAKTNTGAIITVPPFVKEGDKIIVNTELGTYLSRTD